MKQVQSTLFLLYDRNPQTFLLQIFGAEPYRKATQQVWQCKTEASFIGLRQFPRGRKAHSFAGEKACTNLLGRTFRDHRNANVQDQAGLPLTIP